MVLKKEEGTYHRIEKLTKEMPGFLSPGKGVPLLLIPEYSGINKDQRIPDRSQTAHRKPPVKCFLTVCRLLFFITEAKAGGGPEVRGQPSTGLLLAQCQSLSCDLHAVLAVWP